MKQFHAITLTFTLLTALPALAVDTDAVLGGAIGGGVGAAVGSEIGGREGAVVGGALGAAVGTAIATDKDDGVEEKLVYERAHEPEEKVIVVKEYHHVPPGHVYRHVPPGHLKHKHKRKHRHKHY